MDPENDDDDDNKISNYCNYKLMIDHWYQYYMKLPSNLFYHAKV